MELSTGYNECFTVIEGKEIFFKCYYNPSSTEAVVLLHGLACSSESFNDLILKYLPDDITVIVPDLPGYGKSSKPEGFTYTMEDQAKVIEALLFEFKHLNFHIAAHSMSGAIALCFSNRFYERVLTFINIEGNLIAEDCGLLSRRIIKNRFEDYRDKVYEKHCAAFADDRQFRFHQSSPEAIYKSAKSLVELSDSGTLLEKFLMLNKPKCYIYGEENREIPAISLITDIEKIMIKNSGHAMMSDNPEDFYSELGKFLKEKGLKN